jgi:hypothetical protein
VVRNIANPVGPKAAEALRRHEEQLKHLPSDLSQRIFDELVRTRRLTKDVTGCFRGCHLLDAHLAGYPGLEDAWLEVLCDVAPGGEVLINRSTYQVKPKPLYLSSETVLPIT